MLCPARPLAAAAVGTLCDRCCMCVHSIMVRGCARRPRARVAPRAKKQLAPQFYLVVQFTGFYKYLKLFLSHTCALDPIRPESAIKTTWCHATTRS